MRPLKRKVLTTGPADDSAAPYRDQWAWRRIGLTAAWDRLRAMRGPSSAEEPVTVAILDSGLQRDHTAFERIRAGLSRDRVIPPADGDLGDDDGHGTMLAGTIAGIVNDPRGGRGAVPPVRLLAVKFIDVCTPPTSDNAARAVRRAVAAGARVINASWDLGLNNPALRRAIEDAEDRGVLVVVAAGNNGGNNGDYPVFPASLKLPNVISVMATDANDEKPDFSNYGGTVDIAAPGVNIVSAFPYIRRSPESHDLAYRLYSGTSPAAAHVSGAAALLLTINPGWTPGEIRERLMASVDPVPALRRFCRAGGRLNLHNAVNSALAGLAG
ncbi:MAG TPA: S8 family serine peptidase [Stellaceae bacterium]|nr:S8 family serine peptidase [Stellaceae bacterium]